MQENTILFLSHKALLVKSAKMNEQYKNESFKITHQQSFEEILGIPVVQTSYLTKPTSKTWNLLQENVEKCEIYLNTRLRRRYCCALSDILWLCVEIFTSMKIKMLKFLFFTAINMLFSTSTGAP